MNGLTIRQMPTKKDQNILIVDLRYRGHHQEYFNHCIRYINKNNNPNYNLFFLTSSGMNIDSIEEIDSRSIQVIQISKESIRKNLSKPKFIKDFNYIRFVNQYIKKFKISEVLFLDLLNPFWALPFLNKRVKLSGLLLKPYYNSPESLALKNGFKKYVEKKIYFYILRLKRLKKILILNDLKTTQFYNNYIGHKFVICPEPIDEIKTNPEFNLRCYYNIDPNKKILLHFGVIDKSKGVVEIIESLHLLPLSLLDKVVILIAGYTNNQDLINKLKSLTSKVNKLKSDLIILDIRYIEEENKANYFKESDLVLMPYKRYSVSSGIFGYALKFDKSIIGPSKGLIYDLINENNAGVGIDCNPESIAKEITNYLDGKLHQSRDHNYIKNNTVQNFCKALFKDYTL